MPAKEIHIQVPHPNNRKPKLGSMESRLLLLSREVHAIRAQIAGGIMLAINPVERPRQGDFPPAPNVGTVNPGTRKDFIVEKVIHKGQECTATVETETKYTLTGTTPAPQASATYEVEVKVTVRVVCPPPEAPIERSTSHKFHVTFRGDERDTLRTGETTTFTGETISTLTYGNGTKVEVTKSQDGKTLTVKVTYPDGTSTSATVP